METILDKENTKANLTGTLHEVLVGRFLNGKHMKSFSNSSGVSPKKYHDKVKALLDKAYPNEYEKSYNRAKTAAANIKAYLSSRGYVIVSAFWTSKSGDIFKATQGKFNSSQKEDSSDLVLHCRKRGDDSGAIKFVGISLKKTDTNNPDVNSSNMGIELSGPDAYANLLEHRRKRLEKYPELQNIEEFKPSGIPLNKWRGKWQASDKEVNVSIRKENVEFIERCASDLCAYLNSIPKSDLSAHLRTVLAAHTSPMHGVRISEDSDDIHEFVKHTTYGKGEAIKFNIIVDPSRHYMEYFENCEHLTVQHKSGGTIKFFYKDEYIASQTLKFTSQSDPLSSFSSVGKAVTKKKQV